MVVALYLSYALRIAGSIQLAYFLFRIRKARGPVYFALKALAVTIICYLVNIFPFHLDWPIWAKVPPLLGAWAAPIQIWIVSRYLFEDSFRFRWSHAALFVGIVSFKCWLFFSSPVSLTNWNSLATPWDFFFRIVLTRLITIAFAFLALAVVLRGRDADLVEERRQKRGIFIGFLSSLALLVSASEIAGYAFGPLPWLVLLTAAGVTAFTYYLSHEAMAPRPFWEPEERAVAPAAIDLRELMERKKAFTDPELSVARLAQLLGQPEYKVRKHINQTQGFRNFNEFLNFHRVAEAKARLADPSNRELPIYNLSVDLGYGSLVSFHRAFKASTGMTPTEFREKALTGALVAG